jgi:hypothetical protein
VGNDEVVVVLGSLFSEEIKSRYMANVGVVPIEDPSHKKEEMK